MDGTESNEDRLAAALRLPLPPSPLLEPTGTGGDVREGDQHHHDPPTCRVCRSDDSSVGPLFHPCRCTGSIAHVHQDCLSTWLEHSRKASCELCGHRFSFENVYKAGAPLRPPLKTIVLEAAKEFAKAVGWVARCFLVSIAWLALVPLTVKIINNGGLHAGDWTVRSFVLALPRANFAAKWNIPDLPAVALSTVNVTAAPKHRFAPARIVHSLRSPVSRRAAAEYISTVVLGDILQGQIITCAIIVAFVAIFLLREYIIQNLPMDALQALGLAVDPFAGVAEEAVVVPVERMLPDHPERVPAEQGRDAAPDLPPGPPLPQLPMPPANEPPDVEPEAGPPEAEGPAGGAVDAAPPIDGVQDPVEAAPALAAAPALPAQRAEGGALEDGEADDFVLEDLDGLLEAIGLRGGLLTLASSVGLVLIMLGGSLFLFVHVPHFVGKMCILLRADMAISAPFQGMLVLKRVAHRLFDHVAALATATRRRQPPSSLKDTIGRLWNFDARVASKPQVSPQDHGFWLAGVHSNVAKAGSIYASAAEHLAAFNARVERVPGGSSFADRALAVMYGYGAFLALCVLYLVSGVDRTRSRIIGGAVDELLRQVGVIFKVGLFVLLELVVFPTVCGVLLDVATFRAFPDASLASRLDAFRQSPGTRTLVIWIAGTCFMFLFAMLVTACRENLRPGVCWWIRDPSDPRYHPIRDIISRPTLSQLRKITASAFMYGLVIFLGVGAVLACLHVFAGLVPLRIHPNRAWSQTAAELVLYQNILPVLFAIWEPRQRLREFLDGASRRLARPLRLTSFLYGERVASEETDPPSGIEALLWRCVGRDRPITQGGFMRVPGADHVTFMPGRKMHIEVDEEGEPIHAEDRPLIELQQSEARAEQGARPDEDHFAVVFMPRHFQTRTLAYVFSMWLVTVVVVSAILATPLFIGRSVLDSLWLEEQHDVYSFVGGSLAIAACVASLRLARAAVMGCALAARRKVTLSGLVSVARSATAPESMRHMTARLVVAAELAICALLAGLVVPVLASLVVELYALAPLRAKSTPLPTIYLADNWASGMMYVVLTGRIVHSHRLLNSVAEIERLWNENQRLDAARHFHRRIALPLSAALVFAIIAPAATMGPIIFLMPSRFLAPVIRRAGWDAMTSTEHFFLLLKSFYPALPGWYSHYVTSRLIVKMVNQWMGKVRDKAFLDHRRLRKHVLVASPLDAHADGSPASYDAGASPTH